MNAKERDTFKAMAKAIFERMTPEELTETARLIEVQMNEYRNLNAKEVMEFGNGDFTKEFDAIRLAAIEEILEAA